MPNDSYQLSRQAVERLAAAVRKIEGMSSAGGADSRGNRPPVAYKKIWYRIVTNAGGGEYTLRKQEWNTTSKELQDVTDVNDPEYNINITGWDFLGDVTGEVGKRVQGWKSYVNGGWITLITKGGSAASAAAIFAVLVTQTGGAAGSKTTQCSFTYTVKTLAEVVLDTAQTPNKPRPALGIMVAQPADSYGTAFYDGGTLMLWDAGEVPGTQACP